MLTLHSGWGALKTSWNEEDWGWTGHKLQNIQDDWQTVYVVDVINVSVAGSSHWPWLSVNMQLLVKQCGNNLNRMPQVKSKSIAFGWVLFLLNVDQRPWSLLFFSNSDFKVTFSLLSFNANNLLAKLFVWSIGYK